MGLKRKKSNPTSKTNTGETVSKDKHEEKQPYFQEKAHINKKPDNDIVGWLIVHMEDVKNPRTFPLASNKKLLVGRKDDKTKPDIAINFEDNTDIYFSRKHLEIITENNPMNDTAKFFVKDIGTNGGGSTNGTFLNGNPMKITPLKVVEIFDGCTIQAGRTKLVLKTAETAKNSLEATQIVANSPYTQTVINDYTK